MKKSVFILLILSLLAAVSCSKKTVVAPSETTSGKVLVLHSLDSAYCARVNYDAFLRNSIAKNGANPEIVNVYNCGVQEYLYFESHQVLSSLQEKGWVPDVICITDDRLLDNVLHGNLDQWFDITGNGYPIVAAGLHCPDWTLIHTYGNIAICTDLIDFETNLILAKEMSGRSVVTIELDYTDYDMRLRGRLDTETNRPPFVNNSDFHVKNTQISELEALYKDSIFISVFSNANPEKNAFHEDTRLFRKRVLQSVGTATLLSAKKDLDSDDVLNHCQGPQFTAIREGFNDGSGHFLCGYFASFKTVAEDQGEYVAKILTGAKANELPIMSHKREYYADWDAMKLARYDYKTLANAENNPAGIAFQVEGIPMFSRYRSLFHLLQTIGFFILVFLSILFTRGLYKHTFKKLGEELSGLERQFELLSVAMRNTDCIFISKKEDVVALQDRMHPDETIVLNSILYGSAGSKKGECPVIRLTNDDGQTWRRWQFRRGTIVDGDANDLPGVFIDVEDTYRYKEQMAQTAEIAEQIRLKENFVKNITHEIRTPLNAIVGFSQILGMDDGSMSDEERQEIAQYVHESNNDLGRIIDVILKFSRLESGRIDFDPEDTNISDLMTVIYRQWKEQAPEKIKFILDAGRKNVFSLIDRRSIIDIVGQYISNAFKFTESGYVKMGWDYDLDNETVLLYVEDTGKGVSEEKRKFIYNMFWKDDMFVTGVGLGLALAKTYTEKMGGTLVFQTKLGIGSRFGSQFRAQIRH